MKPLLALCLWLLLSWPAAPAEACGPGGDQASMYSHPDAPFERFAAGHLEMLAGTHHPMHLAYAWRWMMGVPTTPEEQRAVVDTWKRMEGELERGDTSKEQGVWNEARSLALHSLGLDSARLTSPRSDIPEEERHIHGDAFERAAETVGTLSRLWRKHPALLLEWVDAQNAIFAGSCQPLPALSAGDLDDVGRPVKPSASVQARRQAERDYQVAASHLYCSRFDEALAAFQAIEGHRDTPYRTRAAYLVARTQVRRALKEHSPWGSGRPEEQARFMARLDEADATITRILARPRLRAVHAQTRRLRSLVRSRTQREAWACTLPTLVLQPGTGSALAAELGDFDLSFEPGRKCPSSPAPTQELLQWIHVMQQAAETWTPEQEQQKREAYVVALARWKQTHLAPWLVAAMLKARGDSPEVGALLVAAARVPLSAPQGLTLALHTVRLLREQRLLDAARERLAAVPLEQVRARPTSNKFVHAERLLLATSWEAFLGIALERVAEEAPWTRPTLADGRMEQPAAFSYAALSLLNTPITARRLVALSGDEQVPPAHRQQLRWTAFVRAAILGDDETLQALATMLAESEAAARSELRAMLGRTTVEERMFEARLLVMGLPVLSVTQVTDPRRIWHPGLTTFTSGKDNWWCTLYPVQATPFSFVSEEERVTAVSEWQRIVEAGSAVVYFSKVALAWAKEHPKDPRSPIALYRAVRASKRVCNQNTPEAMAAFRHLHRHYGKSTWAQQVPYVY
ncbi:hypothetical protein K8640_01150 [Myxococcus sp. XM-1-1-1]|uniref:hypothetical protein n=1 Tax=Myxococcus sp. XM-1-1-1 TaxID=2874602 RepID=UPI001CBF247E|nr:hypothetical protein [Myxococcus sp. XM-1-1-1]MBZ4406808.1 hypothetical protein [Myxococcus sp. XM-1-1-1]